MTPLFLDDPTPTSGAPVAAAGGWCAPPEALCICGAPLHPPHACPVVIVPGPPLYMPDVAAGRPTSLLGIAPDGMGIDELPEAGVEKCCGGDCPCRGEP